ncbi:MAG: hypothetical protein U5N85_05225 [Arcicella sp.]|nr:hypothetical protein [Arcicella sp.]
MKFKNALDDKSVELILGKLNSYATGHRKPSEATKKKILNGLHRFGEELMAVEL